MESTTATSTIVILGLAESGYDIQNIHKRKSDFNSATENVNKCIYRLPCPRI